MNLKNQTTSYVSSLGQHAGFDLFDRVLKTIWATIALSYMTNHQGLDWDQVAHEVAKEWATLADNGICRQPPQALLKVFAPDVVEDRKQDAARAQARAQTRAEAGEDQWSESFRDSVERAQDDRISTATAQDAADVFPEVFDEVPRGSFSWGEGSYTVPPFGMIAAANGIDPQDSPTFRFDAEAEADRLQAYFGPH